MKAAPVLFSVVALCAALALPPRAEAQSFPRRDRSGSPRDKADPADRDRDLLRQAAAAEPFAAMERELPSLRDDLKLDAHQADAFNVFERDVRDAAESGRSRRRHILALRSGGEAPAKAATLLSSLAEDARISAESSADAQRHLDALYTLLDDNQRRLLDRRIVQSQTEPLGRN